MDKREQKSSFKSSFRHLLLCCYCVNLTHFFFLLFVLSICYLNLMIISTSSFSTVLIVKRWKGILCNVIKPLFAYIRYIHTFSFQHTHHAKGLIMRGGNDVLFKFNNMILNAFDCQPQKQNTENEIKFLLQLFASLLQFHPSSIVSYVGFHMKGNLQGGEQMSWNYFYWYESKWHYCMFTTAYGNDYTRAYRHHIWLQNC